MSFEFIMSKNRISSIISSLKHQAYLVTDKSDLFYLTGTELEGFWLLLSKGSPVVFTSVMLGGQLKALLPEARVIAGNGMLKLLEKYCGENGIRRIGLDASKVNMRLAGAIGKFARVEDAGNPVMELRLIKDSGEISRVRESCETAVAALRSVRSRIRPGMTELQIMFKIEEYFAKNGSRAAFPIIVASGPNSANPHHISSARKIKKNDVVLIDLGCVKNGYCSDLTRTFILGKITSPFEAVYSLVREAHDRAVKRVQSGVNASDIDGTARKVISDGGYADNFIHTTGHGLGIEVHEPPRLSEADCSMLSENMLVTVEPGIYLPGKFGVRHENLLLVKKKGNEVLTDDLNS